MPGTNKRINYACLALAYCDQRPIDGVKSVGLSFSRQINNIFSRSSSTPASTYGNLPDIEFSYSSHATYTSPFPGFSNEEGLTDFVSFDLMIGSDTSDVLYTPEQTIRLSHFLLRNVTYSMSVDGTFGIDRSFIGWGKSSDCGNALGRLSSSSGSVLDRSAFNQNSSNLPSILSNTTIQSISTTITINRSLVNEFSTRKPYASYITFPIETECTIKTYITNTLDSFSFDLLETACQNGSLYSQDIKISTCTGSPIEIKKAYLTSYNYAGAEASAGSSNLELTLTYKGYQSPSGISPVIYFNDIDLQDPCACQ